MMHQENKQNIILIGMPGFGKSTAGVVLAKLMGYRFLDSDLVIQEQENRLLSEIIAQEGIEAFEAAENRINAGLDVRRTVIATGGSVIYGRDAMEHFRSIGVVVYLSLPYEELCTRLGDLTKRGVVIRPGQTLWDLYQERQPLYEAWSDIRIPVGNLDITDTALLIRSRVTETLTREKKT